MGVDFKALANRVATVKVGGEEVVIRPPSMKLQKAFRDDRITQGDQLERHIATHEFIADMLADMVVTDEPVSASEWERIITMPADQLPDAEGIEALIDAVMRACGIDTKAKPKPKSRSKARVKDHAQETADAVGKPATS